MTDQFGQCDVKVLDLSNIHKVTKFTPDLTVLAKSLYVACRFSFRECWLCCCLINSVNDGGQRARTFSMKFDGK